MNTLKVSLQALALSGLIVGALQAQNPERQLSRPQTPPGGGRPDFVPTNVLLEALDADKDGEISANEIKNAAAALATLDRNKDGKLDSSELRPQGLGRRGDGEAPGNMAERIMGYDSNKDGKVSKEELPERMQRIMDRLDSNKDGFLTKDELSQAAPPPAPVNRLQGAPGRERVPSRPQ